MLFTRTLIIFSLAVMASPLFAQEHHIRPVQELVPATKTTIGTAVAVWSPIYGETTIASERRYVAVVSGDGTWKVTGSLAAGLRATRYPWQPAAGRLTGETAGPNGSAQA